MSSASSSDLETNITQKVIQKEKKKTSKKKTKPAAVVVAQPDGRGKNEGDDPHWAYEPPDGAVRLDHTVDAGPFEWDTIKDDEDIELWLIRVPDSIKPKYLDGLEIDPPSSSRTACVGGLTKKHASYDVWSIGDDDAEVAGGDELRGLTCLLPRKRKKGKLYIAPKQVSRCIVISAQPSVATMPEHQPVIYQNPPRASYPKDVLKHAFVPYGARSEQNQQTESPDLSMNVDDDIEATAEQSADVAITPTEKPAKSKESKGKKRKVVEESPKRSKKHKTTT